LPTPEATRRARASKRKGSQHETDVRDFFRHAGADIEPLKLNGAEDEGDHVVRLADNSRVVIEAKNEQKINLAGYMNEADLEAANYARHRGLERHRVLPVAIVKARGKSIADAYVVIRLAEFVAFLRRTVGL